MICSANLEDAIGFDAEFLEKGVNSKKVSDRTDFIAEIDWEKEDEKAWGEEERGIS